MKSHHTIQQVGYEYPGINGKPVPKTLAGWHQELSNAIVSERKKYQAALQWCSGSSDFQVGGKARRGWLKIKHLLTEDTPDFTPPQPPRPPTAPERGEGKHEG